jgi:phosphoheptose isomerase
MIMLGAKLDVRPFLDKVSEELGKIDPAEVKTLADAIFGCYEKGRTVFLCGNGGSGSNCSHFCGTWARARSAARISTTIRRNASASSA